MNEQKSVTQTIKDNSVLFTLLFTILTALISFIIYIDTQHDEKISQEIVEPLAKDIRSEILINRTETLQNRQETLTNREYSKKTQEQVDKNSGYIRELEKQSVRMEQKIDDMIKMMEKEFKTNNKK